MTFLEIVQALHREARLPGTAPTTTVGQTGRAADLVAWASEAWNDVQRERDGKWTWLHRAFTLNTVANTIDYEYGDCTDVDAGAVITRFRAWDLNPDLRPLIYLVSDGQSTEAELTPLDWPAFRYLYRRGTHTAGYPTHVSVDEHGKLYLGPKPDGIYRVSGDYWRSNQVLAADDDEPECHSDYHMIVPYKALEKYGFNTVAQEALARAEHEGGRLYEALANNQAYSRFSLSLAGPLA